MCEYHIVRHIYQHMGHTLNECFGCTRLYERMYECTRVCLCACVCVHMYVPCTMSGTNTHKNKLGVAH